MNSGDTITIYLNYTIDGAPIAENDFDEIEFTIGRKRFTLSDGGIVWDEDAAAFAIGLSQADTIDMVDKNYYQIRLKKDDVVVSSDINVISIGNSLSKRIL